MNNTIKTVKGITLTGYNFGCTRYLIQQVATKKELLHAIDCINNRYTSQREAGRPYDRSKRDLYFMRYSAPPNLRKKYIFAASELAGLRKVWRARYTDLMNGEQLFCSNKELNLDIPTGEFGKCWMVSQQSGYTGRIKENTPLMFSRHTPTGDVEFVNSVNNQLCILTRGSAIAEKIKKLLPIGL
jgi:hypothetical protein